MFRSRESTQTKCDQQATLQGVVPVGNPVTIVHLESPELSCEFFFLFFKLFVSFSMLAGVYQKIYFCMQTMSILNMPK